MKDYEQMYYDLLYEYKQALKKIDDLEQQMEILTKCKDMKIKKILVEQLINFNKVNFSIGFEMIDTYMNSKADLVEKAEG